LREVELRSPRQSRSLTRPGSEILRKDLSLPASRPPFSGGSTCRRSVLRLRRGAFSKTPRAIKNKKKEIWGASRESIKKSEPPRRTTQRAPCAWIELLGVLQCSCQRKLDPRVIFGCQLQQLKILAFHISRVRLFRRSSSVSAERRRSEPAVKRKRKRNNELLELKNPNRDPCGRT